MQDATKIKIKELHEVSWKGLWSMLLRRGTFAKYPFIGSVIIAFFVVIFLVITDSQKSYVLLEDTCNLTLSFFPNLLGFTLGGFAIVVGFSNTDLIRQGTSIEEHSTYQILNSIFSYSILVQVVVTLISFLVSWCIKINVSELIPISSNFLCTASNFIILTIVIFCSLFTLLISPLIIINLFTFSQWNNFYYTVKEGDRLEQEAEDEAREQSNTENNS